MTVRARLLSPLLLLWSSIAACTSAIGTSPEDEHDDADDADDAETDDGAADDDTDPGPNPADDDFEEDGECLVPGGATSGKLVRAIYLVPADREPDPLHLASIEDALGGLQLWLRAQLPAATSFRVRAPIEVIETEHTEAYYRTHDGGGAPADDFWNNGLDDAFALTGADFNDPDTVWMFFLAAAPACEAGHGGGATGGVALFSSQDLRALSGQPPLCESDGDLDRCGWVGQVALLTMFALDLPDAADCIDDSEATACPDTLLTQWGSYSYPDAQLSKNQIDYLEANDFVNGVGLPDCQLACDQPLQGEQP